MAHAVLDLSITQDGLRLLVLMNQPCKCWHCSGLFSGGDDMYRSFCVEAGGQPEQRVSSSTV